MEVENLHEIENGFYISKGTLKGKSRTSMEEKKIIVDKFYNLIINRTDGKTKTEMTDYILKLDKYNSLSPEESLNIIPENLNKLIDLYKREYFIEQCDLFGLLDFCGIRIINQVIKSKK